MTLCVCFFFKPIAWHSKVNKKPKQLLITFDIHVITSLIVDSVLKGMRWEKSSEPGRLSERSSRVPPPRKWRNE